MLKKMFTLSLALIINFSVNSYSQTLKPNKVENSLSINTNVNHNVGDAPNFNTLQNSVVTVWSNFGHSTGFIIDKQGLVITNQHFIGPADYLAVQFDRNLKVPAVLLASDVKKDISILWIDLSFFPNAAVANLAKVSDDASIANEKVMTIMSSADIRKTGSNGVVSKVEAKNILSSLDKYSCDSGCPVFNSRGEVIGINTLVHNKGEFVSGIMRIEETFELIETARNKMGMVSKPSATLMPVDPTSIYPFDAAKEILIKKEFDFNPYYLEVGDFQVILITPLLRKRTEIEIQAQAAKSKDGKNAYNPLERFGNWANYADKNKPIFIIKVQPTLGYTMWDIYMFRLNMALSQGTGAKVTSRITMDFYRMRLMCGETEIQPIHPGKIFYLFNEKNPFVNLNDANYAGLYFYSADSINSDCGKLRLEIFSIKEQDKPKVKTLDSSTFKVIQRDFAPYLQSKKKDN